MAIYSKNGAPIQSDITLHPGEILKDELEAREIKQKDFAVDIGIPVTQLNEIINGKRIVSSELAIILESALGIEASFWTNLQAEFDLAKARSNEKVAVKSEAVRLWAYIKEHVNVSYLRKVNELGDNMDANIEKVKYMFNLSDWNDLETLGKRSIPRYFRRSQTLNVDQSNLTTWLSYIKHIARQEQVAEYNPDAFPQIIEELSKILLQPNIISNTKAILSRYGIILIIKDKLEGVNVDGVAFWSISNPVIVLTLRHKRIDNFIFTLFHELAHIHLHLKNDGAVFLDDLESDEAYSDNIEEKEADEYASNHLIAKDVWTNFVRRNPRFDDEIITNFADKCGVPPAVVRGRLCKERIISYKKKTGISYEII